MNKIMEPDETDIICDGGGATQALCWGFPDCRDCPIIVVGGGSPGCHGTPYDDWRDDPSNRNARRMRNFIRDLLVEE